MSPAFVPRTMAETMSAPSLPSKKRRTSSLTQESEKAKISESRLPSKKRKGSHDSERIRKESHDSAGAGGDDDHKRKASLDSKPSSRKGSHDLSSDGHPRGRLMSVDMFSNVLPFDAVPRKESGDSSLRLEDMLPSPPSVEAQLMKAGDHGSMDPPPAAAAKASTHLALEHLDALGMAKGSDSRKDDDSHSSIASSNHRLLMEAILANPEMRDRLDSIDRPFGRDRLDSWDVRGRRDRLESWGGMSDLSLPVGSDPTGATAVHFASHTEGDEKPSAVPGRISVDRDRLNSIASFSEGSAQIIMDGVEVVADLQAFVAAAVASYGEQLNQIAGDVESIALRADVGGSEAGENSSVETPLIGAVVDRRGRPRALSNASGISVDYDAVEAAVSAVDGVDLARIGHILAEEQLMKGAKGSRGRRKLPLNRNRGESISSISSLERPGKLSTAERERIRKRARDVYPETKQKKPTIPLKKRSKRSSPETAKSEATVGTPKASNKRTANPEDIPSMPLEPQAKSSSAKASKGQGNQKWEQKFSALLGFIEERRLEETKDMSEADKADWIWDGNVPTTFETRDGVALGRWVNNQRSAKSSGKLKKEREDRLIDAGLKWSVLTSNSWNEMLEELKKYAKDQTKSKGSWDGNVPTNYQIKTKGNGRFAGEDKNLGRWVNRQRNLYQTGKLRKDRQKDLEKIGLKWSVLSTNSWESMYDTLVEYAEAKKKATGSWDGNVPANYSTEHNPPRRLGRWINRQRSSYASNTMKPEYVEKLNQLGLKWSVHARSGDRLEEEDDDMDDGDPVPDEPTTSAKPDEVAV